MKNRTIPRCFVHVLLLTIPVGISAQPSTFTSVFYDLSGWAHGYGVVQSADSGYFIAGEKDGDALIVKMNSAGVSLWEKKYSFPGSSATFFRIITTQDDNLIAVGELDFGYPGRDLLCMKLTPAGDTLWSRYIDFGYSEYATYVQETSDQGCIISGICVAGYSDSPALFIKLDPAGNILWANTILGATCTELHSVKEAPDHGFYGIGKMENSPGWEEMAILVRLEQTGSVAWAKRLSSNALYASGYDVSVTESGLLCLIEYTYGTLLVKTDFSGNVEWTKKYPVSSNWSLFGDGQMSKLHPTSDAGYIFVTTGQLGNMLKLDSIGAVEWAANLFLESMDVIETLDHGYLIVGNGPIMGVELYPTGNPQIGLIKTDSLGNAISCVDPIWIEPDTVSAAFIPVSLGTSGGHAITDLHPILSDASLSLHTGCVASTGGLDERQDGNRILQVLPNPASGIVQIGSGPAETVLSSLELYNSTGRCVYHRNDLIKLPVQIDFSDLPDGLYYLSGASDGNSYSGKLILHRE